jgi:hypothetical protein
MEVLKRRKLQPWLSIIRLLDCRWMWPGIKKSIIGEVLKNETNERRVNGRIPWDHPVIGLDSTGIFGRSYLHDVPDDEQCRCRRTGDKTLQGRNL